MSGQQAFNSISIISTNGGDLKLYKLTSTIRGKWNNQPNDTFLPFLQLCGFKLNIVTHANFVCSLEGKREEPVK